MPVQIERKNKKTGVVTIVDYLTVAERVKQFHKDHAGKDCSILTEILSTENGVILVKASVYPIGIQGNAFTGHASEKIDSNFINSTSALENAETSAIGRALASAGYIGTEFASADEVANAISNQKPKPEVQPEPKQTPRVVDNLPHPEPTFEEPTTKVVPGNISEAQMKYITKLWAEKGNKPEALDDFVIDNFELGLIQISKSQASQLIDKIK